MRIMVSALMLVGLIGVRQASAGDGAWYDALLPDAPAPCIALPGTRVVTPSNIFDYMDGAGELYLSYDFRELKVREYLYFEDTAVVAEVYRMGNSRDAYGVWSHDRPFARANAELAAGIGQDRDYGAGLLRFWKGDYFVRILAEKETGYSRAVIELGRAISDAIPKPGVYPDLLNELPKDGLLPNSVHYFHRHTVLNYHYYVSDANLLDLSDKTEAVIADYHTDGGKARLLIVRYSTPQAAAAAYDKFLGVYFKDKPPREGCVQIESVERGEFAGIARNGCVLRLVFDAKTQEGCGRLLGVDE